jgi:tRNA-binding EMAP/Myf-like protein
MLGKSENYKEEYCAQIVKIDEIEPVENSDFLVKVVIGDGYQIVVGKGDVKPGDIMVYAKLETQLNSEFLSVNNQYEIGERHLNKNFEIVDGLIQAGQQEEAKKLVGYFNKHGRVRMIRLRKCPSMGCLFTLETLYKWKPELKSYDFSQCFQPNEEGIIEPFNFDQIGETLFIKAYVPLLPVSRAGQRGESRRNKKLKRFNRLVQGQFSFHYDTSMLRENMWRIKPDTEVIISNKYHGTSVIIGNLLTKVPRLGFGVSIISSRVRKELKGIRKTSPVYPWQKKIKKDKINRLNEILESQYKVKYGNITSSRGVIKNEYINQGTIRNFYSKDVWSVYGNKLYPYISEGLTIYGEICGYVEGTQSMIQKGYDYGCEPGTSFLMPYRITFTDSEGNKVEWSVSEVYGWTLNVLKEHPETKSFLRPIQILYHGTLKDLYPDVPEDKHWGAEILKRMTADEEHFGMELLEPLCKNKVPREGIVLRIEGDKINEAFKLKCLKFQEKEAKEIDSGKVDIEMENTEY